MAPRLHPISVIVFLIGAVLAATGITLAIVFGVKECSCPVCPSASPPSNSRTDCSARLFAIRTGVDNTVLPWSDDLLNSSSIAFQNATDMLNTQLSQTLQSGPSSQSFAQISDSQPDNVNYVVSVTKFVKGQNAIVIAYASAAVTGENGVIQSFQNVTDVANQKLTNDQNVTVEPMVNYNSMQFCDVPNTNLSRPDPLNGNPDCPSTTCPVITCPSPSPAPSCPTCPDCPGGVTCPPPVSCPTDSSPSSCPDCPTASCPTSSPGPSSPSTCPVCENSTCPPPIVCSTTVSPANSPSTSVSSIMTTPSCPPCPSVSSPTSSPLPFTCPTCPEPTPCPSVSTSFSCPVCPSSSSCPTSPAPTCPMNSCPTFPSLEPTGTTRISSPLTIATVSSTVPTSQSSSSTTTRTTAPPITSSSTSPKTTVSSTSQGTQRTSSTSSTVTASQSAGIRSTRQGTSQNPVTESSTGTGTSQSPATGTIPSSTASSYSPTTSQQSTTASFYSPTTSQQSSTLTTTFPATTTVSCPGGTFVYDGDLAIVFEVTYIADSSALDAQNLMMNTFISTQLLNYGNFGAGSHQVGAYDFSSTRITKMIGVPYPASAQNPVSTNNFLIGPRDIFAFNSTMSAADILVRSRPEDTEAHIKDGLDYVSTATGRGKFSAVVIVGISDDFVSEAVASSQQLQDAGYHVFTVVLNSTSNFTSLATDSNSSFTLPYPRSSSDANRISIDIGNYLVSQSFQCFGAITTVPTTTAPSTVTTTQLSTTTTQYCRYEFLSSNVIYVFEATTNISLTEMSTSFLSTFLISEAQADLRDTVTWSPYTNFSLIQYPSSNEVHDAIACCDIGQPTQLTYVSMLTSMKIFANVTGLTSTSTGINEGLLFAQSEFGAGNGAIVLFATSTDGLAAAQATATNIQANNISIVTVSVGGQFDLNPLSSPGFQTHYLTDQTDEQALSQEIIRDLKTLGTICVQ